MKLEDRVTRLEAKVNMLLWVAGSLWFPALVALGVELSHHVP